MNYAGERIWANQTELGQSHLNTARPQIFDTVWLGPGLAAHIPTSAHNAHDCAANDRRNPPASPASEFKEQQLLAHPVRSDWIQLGKAMPAIGNAANKCTWSGIMT